VNNSNVLVKRKGPERRRKGESGGRTKSLEAEIMDDTKKKKCIVVIVERKKGDILSLFSYSQTHKQMS